MTYYENLNQVIKNLDKAHDLLQTPMGGVTQLVVDSLVEESLQLTSTVYEYYFQEHHRSRAGGTLPAGADGGLGRREA